MSWMLTLSWICGVMAGWGVCRLFWLRDRVEMEALSRENCFREDLARINAELDTERRHGC
ncbi:hypothetical protein [Luteimonas suaedae]|uniref:hypothetical protein n=1 Tax=Luteimonas suaedae TaxID=2605430 RepID=UPI0011EDDC0D|nr:hypothetical protein [Luteimonas suaedae]